MAGRPTDYREEFCEQAEKLCKLGATDAELADFFGVVESTINLWKIEHSEFSESISRGKIIADMEVAQSLYKSATGFDYTEQTEGTNDTGSYSVVNKRKALPDFRSMRFWLMNRQPTKWRDKQEVDVRTPEGITVVYKKQAGNDPLDATD